MQERENDMVSVRSLFAYFWKDQPRVVYFVLCCCVVLMLAYWKRNQAAIRLKNNIVLPAFLLLVVFGNPASAHILVTRAVETQSLRFFWIIPISLFLAAVTVLMLDFIPQRGLKVAVAIAVIPILLLSGNGLQTLRKNWQYNTSNWYKIPPVVIDLCDYIMADTATEEKSVVCCFPLNLWVRQYESAIYLPFSWSGGEDIDLLNAMDATDGQLVNLDLVSRLASEEEYDYIVIPREGDYVGRLGTYGYHEIYSVTATPTTGKEVYDQEYVLYRLEERSAT